MLRDLPWTHTLELRFGSQSKFLCFSVVQEKRQGKWHEHHRQNDAPDRISPSPRGRFQDIIPNQRPYPDRNQKRNIRQARPQRSVQKVARIGNEDLLEDLQPCATCRIEDLCCCESLDVLGDGHLDVAEDVEEDAE